MIVLWHTKCLGVNKGDDELYGPLTRRMTMVVYEVNMAGIRMTSIRCVAFSMLSILHLCLRIRGDIMDTSSRRKVFLNTKCLNA